MASRKIRDAMINLHGEVEDTRRFLDAVQQRIAAMPNDELLKTRLEYCLEDLGFFAVRQIEDAQKAQQQLKAIAKNILNEYETKKAALKRQARAAEEEDKETIATLTAQAEGADKDSDDDSASLFVGQNPMQTTEAGDDDSDDSLASVFKEKGSMAPDAASTLNDDTQSTSTSIQQEQNAPKSPAAATSPITGQKRARSNTMDAIESAPKRQQTVQTGPRALLSSGTASKYRIILKIEPCEPDGNSTRYGFSALINDVKKRCKEIVLDYAEVYPHFEKNVLNRRGFRCITCRCDNKRKGELNKGQNLEKFAKGDEDLKKPLYTCYNCALNREPCIMERKGTLYLLPLPPQLRLDGPDGSRYWLRDHRTNMDLVEWGI